MFFCKYMVWSITGPSCQGHCLPAIDNGKVCHCFQHTPLVKHYCYWQLIFILWSLKHMVLTLQILRLLWCRWKWTCCKWKEEMWLELKPLRPDYSSRCQRLLLSVSLCHLGFNTINAENWFWLSGCRCRSMLYFQHVKPKFLSIKRYNWDSSLAWFLI